MALWACAEPGEPAGSAPAGSPEDSSAPAATEPPAARRPLMEGRLELATRGLPEGLLVHDVDGDGEDELLAATRSPGSLHLWDDPLAEPRVLEVGDHPLGPVLLGTAAGPRVVLAPRAVPELLLVDPLRLEATASLPLDDVPRALGVGELDGDGHEELVLAMRHGALLLLEGAELREVARLEEGLSTCVLPVADAILVGSQATGSVRAYRAGEAGSFEAVAPVELGAIPRDLALSADASRVLVAAGDELVFELPLELLLGGTGEPVVHRGAPSVPIALARDGAGPIVLGVGSLSFARLGAAGSGPPAYAGQDTWDLATGDLDRDGWTDLCVANRGASRVSWMRGLPGGGFDAGLRVPVGRGPHSLAAGDLDGDGTPEVLVLEAMEDRLTVLAREGATWSVRRHLPAAPAADRLATADVDGDGHVDAALVVRDDAGTRLRLLRGGPGGLTDTVHECAVGRGTGDLLLVDLDEDGRPEAVLSDPAGAAVHLVRWDGERLVPVHSLAVPSSPRGLAAGPTRSLAVALGEPGPRTGYAWLYAQGHGAELRLSEVAHVPAPGFGIDLAVLEDAVALLTKPDRGDGPGRLALHALADGERLFEVATGQRPYALAAGDVDGDGRADLCVGAQNSHHVNLWLRGQDGGLRRLPDLGVGRGVLDVLLVDVDGDGRADALSANNFSNDVGVVRSSGP